MQQCEILVCDGHDTLPKTLKVALAIVLGINEKFEGSFQRVLGIKIVKKEWIEHCSKKNTVLPTNEFEFEVNAGWKSKLAACS